MSVDRRGAFSCLHHVYKSVSSHSSFGCYCEDMEVWQLRNDAVFHLKRKS